MTGSAASAQMLSEKGTMKYVGIDTGKNEIHVCTADPERAPRDWKVQVITTADPDWRSHLAPIVQAPAIVSIESTGYHYSAPLFRLAADQGAAPYEVHNPVTQRIRATHISPTKNDSTDARALAYISQLIAQGRTPHGVHIRNQSAINLRIMINERASLQRIALRSHNRAQTLAYSLDPAYGHSSAFDHLITYDIILPQEARAADLSSIHGNARRSIQKLLKALPDHIETNATTRSLKRTAQLLRLTELQIEQVEQEIIATLDTLPRAREIVELWLTIPGMSLWAACACLIPCNLDPLSMSKDQFKKSIGAAPDSARSGNSNRSKKATGYAPAKVGLHMTAIVHSRSADSPITRYWKERDHVKLFGIKRKLAQAMYGMVKTGTEWKGSDDE
jgi:hypothetical protein